MEAVEIGSPINTDQHSFAIDNEGADPVAQRGLNDQQKSITPIVAVAREQPHSLALALDDQAIAIMLDFVDPLGAGWHRLSRSRNARFKRRLRHAGKIGTLGRNASRFVARHGKLPPHIASDDNVTEAHPGVS
ncbi:hypothetical protein [Bradyrhizobium sp. CB3481]|uniref:hypothetical protein n=1 Tax=Bradyrhizobium sp. CB3481 TaxID=3039158 RepID=UPI0024B03EBC|nr:hypothetical protein [Bradyrhizobium sp. CB3481]WFU14382.1 hypothetical protein QA643_24665 [Bradyrhizobium sp. CB3481]